MTPDDSVPGRLRRRPQLMRAGMPAALYTRTIDAYCTGEPFGAAAQRGYARPLAITRDQPARHAARADAVRASGRRDRARRPAFAAPRA